MFESFSERARKIIFLSRKRAGRRGAAEIGVADLIEALVLEDQGEFSNVWVGPGSSRPFFSKEITAEVLGKLQPLLPKTSPLPDSVDMPISESMKDLFAAAIQLSEELRHEPSTSTHIHAGEVTPLHLMAAALLDETSATAEVLKDAGVTRDEVIAAIQVGDQAGDSF